MKNYDAILGDANVRAFLALIRHCEGANYNTLFGGDTFATYADHPRQKITRKLAGHNLTSTAAGAYQFLSRTWDEAALACGLRDFSPASQDTAAIFLIDRRNALQFVREGRWEAAIARCNLEWASLPGSPYGQPTKPLAFCLNFLRIQSMVAIAPPEAPAPVALAAIAEPPQPTQVLSTVGKLFILPAFLPAFLRAMKAGEELANAETWKNRQSIINAIIILAVAGTEIAKAYGYVLPFSEAQVGVVVTVVVTGLFNIWATFSTSKRVGLPSRAGDVGAGIPDTARERVVAREPAIPQPPAPAGDGVPVLTWQDRSIG